MKRLLGGGGVVLVLALLLVAGRSSSEPQKPPAPHTRVGLINLSHVLKKYEKVNDYTAEMKERFSQFEKEQKERKERIGELSKKAQDSDLSDEEREQAKAELKKLQREMEDSDDKMKALKAKMADKQMFTVYSDLHKATERYAKAHDLELVLHYIDAVKEEEFFDPRNVQSKFQQRSCMPVYVAPGLDISAEIVNALNDDYKAEKERSTKRE
jgi:Skp family chaperone for outer membrane proteins